MTTGSGAADERPRARDRAQALTGVPVALDRVYGVEDLTGAAGGAVLLDGPIEAFTCKGPALDRSGFEARLAASVGQVDRLDFDAASESLDALRRDLPCAIETLKPRELHDVLFYTGLLAAYHDKKAEATDAFGRAAGILPDVPWNPAYPPDAQQLYLLGKEAILGAPPARVAVVPPVDARAAWIDGQRQASMGPMVLTVRPGTHLLQIETQEGVQRSAGLVVAAGDSLWADPRAAAAAVSQGATDGALGWGAASLLSRAAEKWSADPLYVAASGGLYRYSPGRMLARARAPVAPTGDRFAVRAGLGALVREAPYRGRPFAYAAPTVEGEVALVRGLELAGRAAFGIGRFDEGTTSVLPSFSLGLRWAFPGVAVRPYAGLDATVAVVDPGEARVGPVGRAGLRWKPRRGGDLWVAADVAAGWVSGGHVALTATVGAGGPGRSEAR